MRFGDRRESENVESQSGGGLGGFGGGGGGGLGLLFGLVFSRFGIGGVIVLGLILFFVGGNPLGLAGGGGQPGATTGAPTEAASGRSVCAQEPARHFLCQVLGSTEDRWSELLRGEGIAYEPPHLIFYPGRGRSGCGVADSAMGPFYCPSDRSIYLDTAFLDELARRFGAPGDFAQAYVVAHEVGHHVQTLTGIEERARAAQQGASEAEANALQVRIELQADCYAGVWAASERNAMEPGDIEEGMRAAAAIGDDTLQRASQGVVVPESFTHGSSAQRQEALMRGWRGGTRAACASYSEGL